MGNIFRCCGKTGKPSVRVVAYVDITLAVLILVAGIASTAFFPGVLLPAANGDQKHQSTPNIVGIILILVWFFLECCLYTLLMTAVKSRDRYQCKNWIMIRLMLLVMFVFGLLYWLVSANSLPILYVGGGIGLALVLHRVYTLLVVKSFQIEIVGKEAPELAIPLRKIGV